MGRKRLTKECTQCKSHCERKQFSRSMWEKEETDGMVCERVCRQCHFEIKKTREQATLLLTTGSVTSMTTESNKPAAVVFGSATAAAAAVVPPIGHISVHLPPHMDLFGDSFLVSPVLAPTTLTPQLALASASASHAAGPMGGARPRHNSTASSQLAPLNLDDEDFDQEFFEGAELDGMFHQGTGDEREKRSVRAKRRRAKMNALFSALASDVGLSVFADRARVLERTRELIRELRDAKESREVKKLKVSEPVLPMATKPILSILDVVSEHLHNAKDEMVTHSHCA